MSDADAVYETKFGFPTEYAKLLFVCVAFALGGLFLPLPSLLRTMELATFGGGAVALLMLGLRATRRVALRLDSTGITLCPSPHKPATESDFVPWAEVKGLQLSRESAPPMHTVVTIDRRGSRPNPSSPVKGWRLDKDAITAALRTLAPGTRLIDGRSSR